MAQWIDRIVYAYVRSIGIRIILTNETSAGVISVIRIGWVGTDGKYYSLMAPHSETTIFDANNCTVGFSASDTYSLLKGNTRVFETKDDWSNNGWNKQDAVEYVRSFSEALERSFLLNAEVAGYRVLEIRPYVNPCMGLTVWYQNLETELLDSLTVWRGSVTVVPVASGAFVEFIDQLGLKEVVKINTVLQNDSAARIESFGDEEL